MLFRTSLRAVVMAAALLSIATAAKAAGALAIGACAAYGYATDYPSTAVAQQVALQKCTGACNRVVVTRKGCVALAIDGHKPCGPHGYANAPRLGQAQNIALKYCYKFGGKDCVIRAWICDAKG
jgi:hypothetical protein